MKEKLLKKKIVVVLCLGVACGVSPAYADSVTNTTSPAYGYRARAAGETITLSEGEFTASVDNSAWQAAFTDAFAYGFENGGYTGVTLSSGSAQNLIFTTTAKGGNTTVVSSGNLQTLARGGVIGVFGWSGNTTIAGNARIGAAATGGHAVTVSSSNSATADATGYAAGISGNNYATMEVTGNATIQAAATGGSASATCKDTSDFSYYSHAFAQATGYGIDVNQHSSAIIRGNANILVTATGGNAWAYLHSMADAEAYAEAYGIRSGYYSTTLIDGDTNIRVTATGGQSNTTGTWNAYATAYGIYGYDYGTATIDGDTVITAAATAGGAANANAYAYTLYANNYSTININQTPGQARMVRLTGDVAANDHSLVNLTLNNGGSFLRGNVLTNSDSSVNFILANGAKWQPVYDNSNGTYNTDNSIFSYGSLASYATAYSASSDYIGSLALNGGIIDLTWDNPARTGYRTLTIDSLSGHGGTIRMATDLANTHSGDQVTVATGSAVPWEWRLPMIPFWRNFQAWGTTQ